MHFPLPEHDIVPNWGSMQISPTGVNFQPCHNPSPKEVPYVLHMKLRDALFLLEEHGLKVTVVGNIHGTVSKQSKVMDNHMTILLK